MPDPTERPDLEALAAAIAELPADVRGALAARLLDHLVASSIAHALLRVERLEVVDERGHSRVVIGSLGEDGDAPGITVYDRDHHERITLLVDDAGARLAFSLAGNDALVIGVDDPETTAMRPGSFVQLIHDGTDVACGWRLEAATGAVAFDGAVGGEDAGG